LVLAPLFLSDASRDFEFMKVFKKLEEYNSVVKEQEVEQRVNNIVPKRDSVRIELRPVQNIYEFKYIAG
jgi:hypothetical protein